MCALLYVFTLLFFYLSSVNRQTYKAIFTWRRLYESNSVVTQFHTNWMTVVNRWKRTKALIRIVQIVPIRKSTTHSEHIGMVHIGFIERVISSSYYYFSLCSSTTSKILQKLLAFLWRNMFGNREAQREIWLCDVGMHESSHHKTFISRTFQFRIIFGEENWK